MVLSSFLRLMTFVIISIEIGTDGFVKVRMCKVTHKFCDCDKE